MSRPRIASRIHDVPASGIRKFFDIAATMEEVISLGIGEPDFVTPEPIREAAIRSLREGRTAYTSNAGLLELRQEIAGLLKRRYGVDYDPATEILLTVGVSEGLQNLCLATLEPGDEVVIPEPCFVSYVPSVRFAEGRAVLVPSRREEGFQPDVQRIADAITPRTKALLLGYPSNPTGAVLTRDRAEALAQLAEKHDLIVFSDEIYDRLVYGDAHHTCFASLPGMKERTALLGGFSKAYAMTGWRLGWVAGPKDVIAAITKAHQYNIMSAPTMAQYAGLAAMREGEPFVEQMRLEYDRRRQILLAGFQELGLPCVAPQGAFYAFPSIAPTGMDADTFCERLLREEHVAVIPGGNFGPSGAEHVRICYANSAENIQMALERMGTFLKAKV
ncbi:MAG TPA: aminotransferase class I/II-fold pyridoxal phosphate-dependent enzyme [Holophagaceae bacterium]|nr:aminotransferase class I/II-fold pyridoxal phosphate-dependent enzyme [Holophagaceae bacterium]